MSSLKAKDPDMFLKITVNCSYKGQVRAIVKDAENLQQSIAQLKSKIGSELGLKSNEVKYQHVKDDPIDEMFAVFLNKSQINIPVQRISAGKYLFGTKQVHAKIQNQNLLVRVGGGYMGVEQFINQYGSIELAKFMKQKGHNPEGIIPSNK
jgi:hypothetical protein